MMGFIDAAISRSRTTLMMMSMVVLCGLLARAALPIANDPHIVLPYFLIGVMHEGISPEDGERLLIQPVEVELRKVEGIKEISAIANEGFVSLGVEFEPEIDLKVALLDTREAVNRAKSEMPTTAEEPFVEQLNVDDFPLLQINLLSEGASERQMYEAILSLRDAIETVPSVLSADMRGSREEVLEVLIDPEALEAYRISSEALADTLRRNNRLIAAGSLETGGGRFAVKLPSVVETAADILTLPVRVNGDIVVTLADVAEVRRTFKDRTSYARFNGQKAMYIEVKKRPDANVIKASDAVLDIVEKMSQQLPPSIRVQPSLITSEFAEVQVTELQGNIMTALALVMVIVVAAMGFRSGVIVGLGIPVSLLFSVIIIYLLGYTFNFMVMFGMLLGLGMLIDGAIVVTEYADRRMSEGADHKAAYAEAVKRMFWPVTASTATTLAAFLPLMFWPGIPGQFMSYLPVTVFTVLSGSLLYALLFGPVLGTIFGQPTVHATALAETLDQLEHGDPTRLSGFTGAYARAMTRVCARPVSVLGAIALLLITIFWAYGQYGKGTIFFNDTDPQFLTVSVSGRGNFSASEVDKLVRRVEQRMFSVPGIRSMNTQTLLPGSSGGGPDAVADRIGVVFIELTPESDRSQSGFDVIRIIRERTLDLPGLRVEVQPVEQGPSIGKPIQIELRSRYRELLKPAMAAIRDYLDTLPELIDIDDTRALPSIEWRMEVDRAQAAIYGADVTTSGIALQLVTSGVKVGEYRPSGADDAVDIRARYPREYRGIKAMESMQVSTSKGLVPLSNFVSVEPAQGVDTLRRIDGFPTERIRAQVIEGVIPDNVVAHLKVWLSEQDFDPRIEIQFRGANEEQAESIAFVSVAFLLSLLLMFVLLVTQFNSFYQSLLILLAVIMSTAGVLVGLLLTDSAFSAILTGIGIVSLAGIVVNNNIVLIDTFNYVRQRHPELPLNSIIVRATAQRLRPVLLTTATTVFGLLPLALSMSVDLINRNIKAGGQMAVFWEPLSQAIVFGLSFAALLTLVATPALLALPSYIRARWQGANDPNRTQVDLS
ncbi:efflux RND transporter permease subunit [Luminiphilus sp.]|nr:efflux RND transporter permease subunit [Luminiphilus sp.]|tara:strand:- start:927 stop:4094 length:3168 start_codon:yes stop_codon:yes gene_type:complete